MYRQGTLALTGRAHCQRQVAFFKDFGRTTKMLYLALVVLLIDPLDCGIPLDHIYARKLYFNYSRLSNCADFYWWIVSFTDVSVCDGCPLLCSCCCCCHPYTLGSGYLVTLWVWNLVVDVLNTLYCTVRCSVAALENWKVWQKLSGFGM